MGPISEAMQRIDGLFERCAPALLRQPCLPEPLPRKRREVPRVWRTAAERAQAEQLLLGGRAPKQVAIATGLPYGTVLGWSVALGLKWPRGPKGPRVKGQGGAA